MRHQGRVLKKSTNKVWHLRSLFLSVPPPLCLWWTLTVTSESSCRFSLFWQVDIVISSRWGYVGWGYSSVQSACPASTRSWVYHQYHKNENKQTNKIKPVRCASYNSAVRRWMNWLSKSQVSLEQSEWLQLLVPLPVRWCSRTLLT